MPLPPTTIRNATSGAIPDPTVQQWGHAFQLAQAYYYWSMQHNDREVLTSGALADRSPNAIANLFSDDLADLDRAKQANGVLVYTPPRIPTIQLVVVPAELQAEMHRQGLGSQPYAFAVQFVGPSRRAIRSTDGTETEIVARDATYSASLLIWGELRSDSDLGPIWYESGNYGCDERTRNVCQL